MSAGGVGEEVLTTGYLSHLSRGIRSLESLTAGIPARKKTMPADSLLCTGWDL